MSLEVFESHNGFTVQDVVCYDTGFKETETGDPVYAVGRLLSIFREDQVVCVHIQPWEFSRNINRGMRAAVYTETDEMGSVPISKLVREVPSYQVEIEDMDRISPQWLKENIRRSALEAGVVLHGYQKCTTSRIPPGVTLTAVSLSGPYVTLPCAQTPVWWMWSQFDFDDPECDLWNSKLLKACLWDWQVHPNSWASRNKNQAQWNHVINHICPEMHANKTPWIKLLEAPQDWATFKATSDPKMRSKRLLSKKTTAFAMEQLQILRQLNEADVAAAFVVAWLAEVKIKGEKMVDRSAENRLFINTMDDEDDDDEEEEEEEEENDDEEEEEVISSNEEEEEEEEFDSDEEDTESDSSEISYAESSESD